MPKWTPFDCSSRIIFCLDGIILSPAKGHRVDGLGTWMWWWGRIGIVGEQSWNGGMFFHGESCKLCAENDVV
ncbi:hypothetical protein M758_10G079900 [Ceratodon purpureus]|nr:hypothetical protein M758_10G079900 [Ceratodon purpureus]